MSIRISCIQCKRTFDASRDDARFCSDECKAKFHREQGNTHTHDDLPSYRSKSCEYCGTLFWYNDYAARGGQRPPTYHNAACRAAAFRERKRAKARAEARARDDARSWESLRQHEREHAAPKQHAKHQSESDFRDSLSIPRRWNTTDALIWIFGSSNPRTMELVNKACRDLNLKYHPDRNSGEQYKHLSTINAAWDYLKRSNR